MLPNICKDVFNLTTTEGQNQVSAIDGWFKQFGNRGKGQWGYICGLQIEELILVNVHTKVKNNQNGIIFNKNIIDWGEYKMEECFVKKLQETTVTKFNDLKQRVENRLQATSLINGSIVRLQNNKKRQNSSSIFNKTVQDLFNKVKQKEKTTTSKKSNKTQISNKKTTTSKKSKRHKRDKTEMDNEEESQETSYDEENQENNHEENQRNNNNHRNQIRYAKNTHIHKYIYTHIHISKQIKHIVLMTMKCLKEVFI